MRRTRKELTQGDLRRRDRLAAVEAAGLRARPVAGEILPRTTRTPRAWCWKATACSPGATRQGMLRDDDSHHQPGHRMVRDEDRGQAGLRRRRSSSRCRAGERRAIAARLMPEIRGLISDRRAQARPFRRSGRGAGIRQFARTCEPLAALGTSCPDHFLRTKIRPLVIDFDPAKPDVDAVARRPRRRRRGLPRRLRRPTTSAASIRTARRCAIPTRWSIWCPASACSPSPRTRRRRASPANSTSTPSMSCAAPRPSRPMSACPSRKPSTSNTGCSRKPSCSACRSRRRWPARIALVTGGAGGIGRATAERLLREGACVVLADIDETALASDQ